MSRIRENKFRSDSVVLCSVKSFVFALLATLAFFMNYDDSACVKSDIANRLVRGLMNLIYRFDAAVLGMGFAESVVFFAFLFICYYFFKNIDFNTHMILARLLALVFALFNVAGKIYLNNFPVYTGFAQLALLIVACAGFYCFYYVVIKGLFYYSQKDIKHVKFVPSTIKRMFINKPMLFSFVFMMICWSVHMLLKYPAGICWDASYQIDQGMGNVPLTTHHPVFHTMMMTWFIKFGMMIKSANIGIFLFVAVEAVVLALVLSYGVSLMVKMKSYKWTIVAAMLFCGFSPFVTGYVGTVVKDVYFTAFSVLFTIVLIEYAITHDEFWSSWKKPLLLLLSAIGMCLFRNNGIYVIIPTVVVLIIYEIATRSKKVLLKIFVLFLVCILPFLSVKVVESIYKPQSGSIAEALSLPFQQTARFVTYHSDLVTDEEKEVINKILPYDDLAELYNPYISDPVKAEYNKQATTADLVEYLKVWARQFLRSPGCYVSSVWQQNVILAYPEYNNYVYYIGSNSDNYKFANGGYFETPEAIEKVQSKYHSFLDRLNTLPVLNIINNMSVYTMALLALIIFILSKRDYKQLLYVFPVLLAMAIIVVAPCIRWHVRYSFPIVYALPILFGIYTSRIKEEKTNG